jgi:superfamily I DNA/RNA helicase
MVDMGWFNEEVDIEFIDKVFKDYSFLDKSGDKMEMIKWFENNLLSSKRKQFELPINLYKNNDIKDGNLDIKIKIGTVHSVKGGEADVVYLFPDLSYSAMKEYNKQGVSKDSVIRTMYVGMTRAKEKLVLCDSESTNRVKWQ